MKKRDMPDKTGGSHYDLLKHMVLIIGIDGKVKYINDKGAEMLRYPKSKMAGRDWLRNFIAKEYHQGILQRISRAIEEKKIDESYEHPVKCGDGKLRVIRWYNNLIFDSEGNVKEILKSGEDITEQRHSEKKLKESEENYRTLVENIYQVVFSVNFNGDIKKIYPRIYPSFASNKVKEFCGYSIDEFKNGSIVYLEQIHPEDRDGAAKLFFKMLETKKPVYRTYRFRHKNGNYKWFEDTQIPKLNDKNNVIGLFGVVYEITDKVQQLETIKEYEKFFSLSQDMFCIAGTDGYFKKINQSFERVLGYTMEELLKRPFFDFVHPDDLDKTTAELVKLKEGATTINFENRYLCKDGSFKWLSWTSSPADISDLVYAVARNITEQKIKDEQLRKNEAFLNSVVENIPNMIFVKDAKELKFVRFNKAGEDLLGYKREVMIGKNDYDFFPKDEADFFTQKDRMVLKGKKLLDITEEEIKTRKKGKRILHTKKIPLYDENDKPEYLLGISEDITEAKKAQEALRENEQKLIEAQKIAGVGSWEFNVETNDILWSEETYRLFGLEPNKGKISREEFRNFIHPDDRDILTLNVENAMRKGIPFEMEMRVVLPDKGMHYLVGRCNPVKVKNKVVKLIGTGMDITERKAAESREMNALVKGQDSERRRIAEDLHDSLGQQLSAIKMFVENNCRIGSKTALDNAERLGLMLNETITEVRNISHNLMPAGLEDFGLTNALGELCNKSSRKNGTLVKFQAYDVKSGVDKSIKFGVYRIAQELVNNAIKHAKAKEISVQLFQRDKTLILTVEDDGMGFKPQKTNFDKTFGLNSITSRAKALNGFFNIDTHPGKGTIASVEIPVKK